MHAQIVADAVGIDYHRGDAAAPDTRLGRMGVA
jgi:hypothetical protein